MEKKTRKIGLIALMTLSILSLSACVNETPKDTDGNQIVTMSLMNSPNENPGWLAMIEAANGILSTNKKKVQIKPEIIKTASWDEYYTKISSNMLGKIGGTIGRISEAHLPLMVEKRQLQDLTSVKNSLVATGGYSKTAFDGINKKADSYYGLPTGTQHMVLYYNKTIFDTYNTAHPDAPLSYPSADWDNPSTFAEIRETANKLTSGTGSAKRFGLSAGPFLSFAGMYAVNSGGKNIFDENGDCVIKSQPFYDVYDWFTDMLLTDKSMPSTSDTATLDAMARFQGGNVAMIVDGVWQIHDVCKYTGDSEIGVAAIPVSSKGRKAYSTTFADQLWAARNSKNAEADKIAIEALLSAEAIGAVAGQQVGGFPLRNDSVSVYMDSIRKTKLSPYVDVIKEGIERGVKVPYSTYYNIVDQQINQKMAVWINGKLSSHDFVDFMDSTMKLGMEGRL